MKIKELIEEYENRINTIKSNPMYKFSRMNPRSEVARLYSVPIAHYEEFISKLRLLEENT